MARKTVHTIYGLFDPADSNQEIRYVGSTKHTPEQRLIDHLAGARRFNATHKQKWLRKLFRSKRLPAIKVLEVTTSRLWKERERFWIASLLASGSRLTNSTEGGEGLINPSKDVRRRIAQKVSKLLVGNKRRAGIRGTPEFGERLSKALRASKKFKRAQARWRGVARHVPTEAEREATSIRNKGRPRPDLVPIAQAQAVKNIGSFWVNDSSTNQLLRPGQRMPKGFKRGRLMVGRPHTEETKAKLALARTGKPGPKISRAGRRSIAQSKKNSRWITDGAQLRQVPVGSTPPEGWRFGRK